MSIKTVIAVNPNIESFNLPGNTGLTYGVSQLTFVGFVCRLESPGATQQLFVWDINVGTNSRIEWQLDSNYIPEVFLRAPDGGAAATAKAVTALNVNQWYHVAFVLDLVAQTGDFWLDGVLDVSRVFAPANTAFDATNTGNASSLFDNSPGGAGSQPWGGIAAHIRVFHYSFSDEEIQSEAINRRPNFFHFAKWWYDCCYGKPGNVPGAASEMRNVSELTVVPDAPVMNNSPTWDVDEFAHCYED